MKSRASENHFDKCIKEYEPEVLNKILGEFERKTGKITSLIGFDLYFYMYVVKRKSNKLVLALGPHAILLLFDKNLFVLIYSKLHMKSSSYQYK